MANSTPQAQRAPMTQNVGKVETGVERRASYAQYVRDPNKFAISWELVPGRGACEKSQDVVLETAKQLALSGRIQAVTITDNPGGTSALSAAMLGAEIRPLGIEPLVHLTCKDKNRNEIESLLYGLARAGVHNLLLMTGDYPKAGAMGAPKPVFDLDPVTLMMLVRRMNGGLEVPTLKASTWLKPTNFFAGVAASPFKAREAEQMGQYFKLGRKLKAGAHFLVSQVGFDARKFHELLQVVKLLGGDTPVIGNIYVLPLPAARLMNANGLPGCVVPDKLLAEIEHESKSPDKGKSARLGRAAKLYAILKGMGFAGTHISGNGLSCDDVESLIQRGEELSANWPGLVRDFDYSQKNGWYYFEKDEKTGLNSDRLSRRAARTRPSPGYRAMSFLHSAMFERSGKLFDAMRRMATAIEGTRLEPAFTQFEHLVKGITSDCLQCGDCALLDIAYLCPQSQCPKNQRNGPCGGSRDGFCEKFPNEKECIYVRAYERAGFDQREAIPPVNHELNGTSSWLNFFLGRDHSAKRLGILKIERKGTRG